MLDLKFIRENSELVKKGAVAKNSRIDVEKILELDNKRRKIIQMVDGMKAERNRVSQDIGRLKKEGKSDEGAILEMRQVSEQIKNLDMRNDPDTLLPPTNRYVATNLYAEHNFGMGNLMVFTLRIKEGDVYQGWFVNKVQEIHQRLVELPEATTQAELLA